MNNIDFKIGGIVVLYNPDLDLLKASIDSYIDAVDKLFIIDNSPIQLIPRELVKEDKISYKYLGENKGIAYALNVGLKLCRLNGISYVLTMDQDTIFDPKLEKLPLRMFNDEVFAITPNFINSNKGQAIKPIQSGALFNMKGIDRVGDFNEKYFIDYVDYDYFERGKRLNLKIIEAPNMYIKHKNGDFYNGTVLGLLKYKYKFSSPIRMYYQTRNALDYIARYKDFPQSIILLKLFLKILLVANHKKIRLKYFLYGIRDYIKGKWGNGANLIK